MALWKRNDGSFVIRYYLDGRKGRKIQETLGRIPYKEAVRIHKAKVAEAAQRRGEYNHRLTFNDLAREYMEVHGPRMAAKSRQRAEEVIRLHLSPAFGTKLVSALGPVDVEKLRTARTAAGAKPATVNREWTILKAILNKGEAWGLIERNPIRRGAVAILPAENKRLVYFEPEEWMQMISAFDDITAWAAHVAKVRRLGPVTVGGNASVERRFGGGRKPGSDATQAYLERLRACVPVLWALLYTGSRLGEVLAIAWEDVDLKRNVITIRQQKTKKSKTVPVSTALRELLLAQLAGVGKAPVFRRPDGGVFRGYEVQRAFAVAKKVAGIRDELTPHSIRHTFASWLAIKGTPLRTIQELLGHADVRMTLRYSHLSPAHLLDAVEAIAAFGKTAAAARSVATEVATTTA